MFAGEPVEGAMERYLKELEKEKNKLKKKIIWKIKYQNQKK